MQKIGGKAEGDEKEPEADIEVNKKGGVLEERSLAT